MGHRKIHPINPICIDFFFSLMSVLAHIQEILGFPLWAFSFYCTSQGLTLTRLECCCILTSHFRAGQIVESEIWKEHSQSALILSKNQNNWDGMQSQNLGGPAPQPALASFQCCRSDRHGRLCKITIMKCIGAINAIKERN